MLGVVCWVCWGGLRLLRVAWADFVCGFWAGLGVLWCWLGGALGWLGAGFGVAVACVVIPCLRSYACWAGLGVLWCWLGAGLGSVGGIATIGAALRRVAGVSGVYGRKTPRGCLDGPALCARGGVYGRKIPRVVAWNGQGRVLFRWLCWSCSACLRVFVVVVWLVFVGGLGGIATIGAALRRVAGVSGVYGRKTPRVLAQSAVDLGEMRVTWGVWGVVDDGLGALVRGEAFSARRRVGYVGPQCVLPG